MNQTTDQKTLAYQIGTVLADILMIVGGIFTIVALIAMEKNGTNSEYYLNTYDYNLMTMKIYGIAMMISGFISYLVNIVMVIINSSAKNEKNKELTEGRAKLAEKS